MMWALLQQRHFGRKVVAMPLALHQDRSGVAVGRLDVEKVQDDVRGYALFSALKDVSQVFVSDGDLRLQLAPARVDRLVSRVRKYLNERLAAFRLSFHRVRGLASVLRDLVESDGAWWREEKYADARNRLRAFCDRLDASYANNVLADIEHAITDIRDLQIKTFLAELPAELERHRARLAEPAALARGFERERIANAKAVARRLAEPAGALGALGHGNEGVVLTDGKHVYKVFDYWRSWQFDSTVGYLRSLVGAWENTRSLYPLLAFHHEGRDAVLVYPFEPSAPYTGGHGPGLVNLLVECRQQGVACRNIHPDNLRVVDEQVRLVDYGSDIRPLDDEREFTTMCQRAWLSFRCHDRPDLKALMRWALAPCRLAGAGWFRPLPRSHPEDGWRAPRLRRHRLGARWPAKARSRLRMRQWEGGEGAGGCRGRRAGLRPGRQAAQALAPARRRQEQFALYDRAGRGNDQRSLRSRRLPTGALHHRRRCGNARHFGRSAHGGGEGTAASW